MCAALSSLQTRPLSGGKFRIPSRPIPYFHALPLQAPWACFFLFCLFSTSHSYFSPSRDETGFWTPGVGCCPRIRSQLGHTSPTGLVWGCTGVVSLPRPLTGHKSPHRAEFGFSCQNELTPPPKGGGAGYRLFGLLGFSLREARCFSAGKDGYFVSEGFSRQLPMATAGHSWPNRAGLGLRWCRFPTRLS